MAERAKPPARPGRKTLAGVVGAGVAALVLTYTPLEESGRKVSVKIDPVTQQASVTHLSGPQYLKVYLDIIGVPTACDGLTGGMRPGMTFTAAQCDAMLEAELIGTAEKLKACAPVLFDGRHDNPLAASILLAHNIGTGGFCGSTAARRFRAGDVRGGCDAFLPWNKVTVPESAVRRYRARGEQCTQGRDRRWRCTVKGLTERRTRERALCMKGARS